MSYVTVAESDQILKHSELWAGLAADKKENHLATAALWLNFSYEWPGCVASCDVAPEGGYRGLPYTLPFTLTQGAALTMSRADWPRVICGTTCPVRDTDCCEIKGVPQALKIAQATAALQSVTVDLFGIPASPSDGGLTKKLIKAGPVTIERQWSEPTRGSEGQLVLTNIDAILMKIGTRRGSVKGVGVMVV